MTVSAQEFKNVMSRVASTVTVVTAPGAEGPVGLTVSAFMSVSADPAVVLVCLDKSTSSLESMLDAEGFTVNVMPEGTEDEVMLFAARGADKFGNSDWSESTTPGAGPVLANALARLECVTIDRTEMGDHWVLYGEVNATDIADSDTAPLVWLDRGFVKVAK
ncbi:MAG: flavin reductase family protein [Acidimicrobiia bacterium]|nr:MAG: flavin reductase family protein [Acidimicrobiia bacterium]